MVENKLLTDQGLPPYQHYINKIKNVTFFKFSRLRFKNQERRVDTLSNKKKIILELGLMRQYFLFWKKLNERKRNAEKFY
ncbi:MAG: hypothetical protein JW786_12950 [Desulfobacterales bacterium]|nr:hypothetical protein [Desulfobacterales bacterium]